MDNPTPINEAGDRLASYLAGPTMRGFATMGGFLVSVCVTRDIDGWDKLLVVATEKPPFPMMDSWEGFPVTWNVKRGNQPRPAAATEATG